MTFRIISSRVTGGGAAPARTSASMRARERRVDRHHDRTAFGELGRLVEEVDPAAAGAVHEDRRRPGPRPPLRDDARSPRRGRRRGSRTTSPSARSAFCFDRLPLGQVERASRSNSKSRADVGSATGSSFAGPSSPPPQRAEQEHQRDQDGTRRRTTPETCRRAIGQRIGQRRAPARAPGRGRRRSRPPWARPARPARLRDRVPSCGATSTYYSATCTARPACGSTSVLESPHWFGAPPLGSPTVRARVRRSTSPTKLPAAEKVPRPMSSTRLAPDRRPPQQGEQRAVGRVVAAVVQPHVDDHPADLRLQSEPLEPWLESRRCETSR